MTDITICVVSYNTRDLLANCLLSVVKTVNHVSYEIFVIDNASEDGSAEMVASEFPMVRLIRNDFNRGFAAASNQALILGSGRHFLFLNSDARLEPDAAATMTRYLDAHPDVGIVGGQLRYPDGAFQSSFADFPSLTGELLLALKVAGLVYGSSYPSYPEEMSQQARFVDWVSGAFLMARRAAVDAVGLMDESYFMYTEETDWCFRMRRAGWLVAYLPDARAVHGVAGSARKAPERRRTQVYRSKWLFLRKYRGRRAATIFYTVVKAVSVAKLATWAALALVPGEVVRPRARLQVRSYATLLREL